MRLVTGLASSFSRRALMTGWSLGGIVFLVSMLLDRVDGELARQTSQMSLTGHRYDLAAHGIAGIATFVGLGIGLAPTGGFSTFWFGALAGLGIGALFLDRNVWKVRFGVRTRFIWRNNRRSG